MQQMILCALLAVLTLIGVGGVYAEPAGKVNYLSGVAHFKQSTIRIQGAKVVYFDPFRVDGESHDADLILISHTHSDHFSIGDLKKVAKPSTMLVVPPDAVEKLHQEGYTHIVTVVPNQGYEVEGIKFRTVPAYNIDKQFHPREKKWVGYLLDMNQVTYYFAGDTDLIPEMKTIRADVAFLPVGGTYTMDATEAVKAANLIKPKVAVPIHFADVVGTIEDAKKFVGSLEPPIQGVILRK